jgi:hypothetical protein
MTGSSDDMQAAADSGRAPPLVAGLLDRVSGFDFFVSYAHADAPGYAASLAQQLQRRGFRVFLDKQVYVAGDELNAATQRRIRASSKLVVLVGAKALDSHWVLREVETAIAANRPVIAIDLLGDLSRQAGANRLAELLRDRIHIREPTPQQARAKDSQSPSAETLQALTRSFQATRRDTLRLRLALAGALFFAVLAGFSYWQKGLADGRAEQYLRLCERIVAKVDEGQQKIENLRISRFGELIADITNTLAQLPDPAKDPDLHCIPVGS